MKQFSKSLSVLLMSIALIPLSASANMSDDLDKNVTPAPLEEREEEVINSSDAIDENYVPAPLEERERQEEAESDYLQGDDPDQNYEVLDEELDE